VGIGSRKIDKKKAKKTLGQREAGPTVAPVPSRMEKGRDRVPPGFSFLNKPDHDFE